MQLSPANIPSEPTVVVASHDAILPVRTFMHPFLFVIYLLSQCVLNVIYVKTVTVPI